MINAKSDLKFEFLLKLYDGLFSVFDVVKNKHTSNSQLHCFMTLNVRYYFSLPRRVRSWLRLLIMALPGLFYFF